MEDTIAAVATAPGEGGIGIIRISGEKSKEILDKVFVPAAASEIANRRMTYGHIKDSETGRIIDEVLCVYMQAPKTYTAEDVVEINCHGGMVPLRKTLQLVLENGARMAEPGEFTKRAFLNGRLDLTQAEAVIDVIKAKTDKTFDVAMDQLEGVFSAKIKEIRKKIVDILVNVTVNIDYPDEDIEEITFEKLEQDLCSVQADVAELLASAQTGKIIQEGLAVSIIGKPNVGKSSLMNSLLGEGRAIVTEIPGTTRDTIEEHLSVRGIPVRLTDTAGIRRTSLMNSLLGEGRAIVTEIPGTTRDTIEEHLSVRGIPVRLTDTAGIRRTDDIIEQMGIEKSKESFNQADLVIFILDSSRELSEEDREIINLINRRTDDIIEQMGIEKSKESFNQADLVIFILDSSRELSEEDREIINLINPGKTIVVLNKADLESVLTKKDIEEMIPEVSVIETSMATGEGISLIEDKIVSMVYGGSVSQQNSVMVTNVRHRDILQKAEKSLTDAVSMTRMKEALEFIEIDISSAYEALGEIIGETVKDDIINEVFARFCLGK